MLMPRVCFSLLLVALATVAGALDVDGRLRAALDLAHTPGHRVDAADQLTALLPDLVSSRFIDAQRLIGHLCVDEGRESTDPAVRERLFDRAAAAYLVAADKGDILAGEHYLALECSRSGERGYAAAWRYMKWDGSRSGHGWSAVIGNYGAAMTAGKGIPGLVSEHPGHAAVWGGLLAVFFATFVYEWQFPARAARRASRGPKVHSGAIVRGSAQVTRPGTRPGTGAVANPRASTAIATPRPGQRPVRASTEVRRGADLERLRQQGRQAEKAETESFARQTPGTQQRPVDERRATEPERS